MLGGRKVAVLGGEKLKDSFSLDFDGTDDSIKTTLAGSALEGDFTISAWVNRTTNDEYNTILGASDGTHDLVEFYVTKSSATS